MARANGCLGKPEERLELPIHQILIRPKGFPAPRGEWEPTSEEFEIFLNEGDEKTWRYRRDPEIARPFSEAILKSSFGVPFLAPEIQLLYKAKHHRSKDDLDFAAALPCLDTSQRAWLKTSLHQLHPDDKWISSL